MSSSSGGNLGDGELSCWGWREGGRAAMSLRSARVGLPGLPMDLLVGAEHICLGDPNGNVACDEGRITLAGVWHFDVGGPWICAAMKHGGVTCVRDAQVHVIADLEAHVDEVFVRADGTGLAIVDDQVYTWQFAPERSEPAPPADLVRGLDPWAAYVAIQTCASGPLEDCATLESPSVAALRTLDEVARGPNFGCGIDASGGVACAWFRSEGQTSLAAASSARSIEPGELIAIGEFRAKALAVAETHACALDEHDMLHCWGNNDYCQTDEPIACGAVGVEPHYPGVDLQIPGESVLDGETATFVATVDERSEVRLTLTSLQLGRPRRGRDARCRGQLRVASRRDRVRSSTTPRLHPTLQARAPSLRDRLPLI